ncbi:MAG: hypothetical protein ACYTE1_10390 [Planctomycetota bacterium]|jgi:hypothetical protein
MGLGISFWPLNQLVSTYNGFGEGEKETAGFKTGVAGTEKRGDAVVSSINSKE